MVVMEIIAMVMKTVTSEGAQSETDHQNYGDDNNVDSFT